MVFRKLFSNIIFVAGATLLGFGCVGSPPMIVDVKYAVVESFTKDTRFISEYLNIFVKVVEEDGFDDLDALYIISDANMVYWTLDPQSWSVVEDEQGVWVGSDSLANPDSLFLDGGAYRIEVYDKAGERDQFLIEIDNQRLSSGGNFVSSLRYSPTEDMLSIESIFPRNDVQFIIDGESLISTPESGTSIPIANLLLERSLPDYRNNLQLYLFSYDDSLPLSYIVLGPFDYDDIYIEDVIDDVVDDVIDDVVVDNVDNDDA